MTKFDFYTAGRILFERGAIRRLPELCNGLGSRFMIVCGGSAMRKSGVIDTLAAGLEAQGISAAVFEGVAEEPTPETVDAAVQAVLDAGADALIGIGGGSVMDTAKAAAGVAANGGSVRDYLEGVGTGRKVEKAPLPFIAVPTTSGTGTEVTKNAVIMSVREGFKKSIRDEKLIANIALLDPELTLTVPPGVTAASGMDAVCQLIESFVARQANAFCDAMALYHTPLAVAALPKAFENGQDIDARETMALASLVSGITLANAGLGAAHGIGAGLGAVLGVRHGVACGMLLPHVMRYNIRHGVTKYAALGRAMGADAGMSDEMAALFSADAAAGLAARLGLPARLGELGVSADLLPRLAAASMGSSMRKNPVEISERECLAFLKKIL